MIRTLCLLGLLHAVAVSNVLAQTQLRPTLDPDRATAGVINDVAESTVALHPATPFLEPSSAALLDIDLNSVNVQAAVQWVQETLGVEIPPGAATGVIMADGFLKSLKDAGVEHVYVCASTRSPVDLGPVVVIPCDNTEMVNELASGIVQNAGDNPKLKSHVGQEVVLVGPTQAVDRLVNASGVERPDLIMPTEQPGRLDHTLVISLPQEARDDLIALWPDQLPSNSPIQLSPRALVADIQRFVFSWRLPPEPEFNLRLDCTSAPAALRVTRVLTDAIALSSPLKQAVELKAVDTAVTLKASPQALVLLVVDMLRPAQRRAAMMTTQNDLKRIGLAMFNYHSVNKHLPPSALVDDQGKPLLSWRVTLLPYLDQEAIYQALKLDQTFDSDANRVVAETAIPVFGIRPKQPTKTTYRAPVFPGSLWDGDGPPKRLQDIRDGLSATIALIDAPVTDAVDWADPQPWIIDREDPLSDVFGDRDRVAVLLGDGSVKVFQRGELDNKKLKAWLTIAGGEVIE